MRFPLFSFGWRHFSPRKVLVLYWSSSDTLLPYLRPHHSQMTVSTLGAFPRLLSLHVQTTLNVLFSESAKSQNANVYEFGYLHFGSLFNHHSSIRSSSHPYARLILCDISFILFVFVSFDFEMKAS